MANFTYIVNGWHFANPQELLKRIALAEEYAKANAISEKQQKVLAEMKKIAEKQIARAHQ